MATSYSTLWDLLISVEVSNSPILPNKSPMVTGQVVDHAGKPISNAEVQIRLGSEAIVITTNQTGRFNHYFENLELIPGMHMINVKAVSEDNKIGLSNTSFQVKGPLSVSSHTAKILSTPEAKKYLESESSDFENNPIGLKLYDYYQGLKKQFQEEEFKQIVIENNKEHIQVEREISRNLTAQKIEEFSPGSGIYSGWRYDYFVDNLDSSVKEIIKNQLNYTVSVFREAQQAMSNVLENGGNLQNARQAYYEKAAISQQMMNQLSVRNNHTESGVNEFNSTEVTIIPAEEHRVISDNSTETDENVQVDINGTKIQVGMSGTIIYLNVNGTLIEFLVNGTQIVHITNSSNS